MTNDQSSPPNWDMHLNDNEKLAWEGRPAPRCYVFKRWKDTLFGFVVLALSCYWLKQGVRLTAEDYPFWLALLPVPVILGGLYMSVGKLIRFRLRWEQVFYAITNERILCYNAGKAASLPLSDITYFRLDYHGEQLGSLTIFGGSGCEKLVLDCIEYPHAATELLEPEIKRNEARQTATQSGSESC